MFGEQGQISRVFAVFECVLEGHYGCTKEVFERLAEFTVLDQLIHLFLERTVFLFEFLLFILILLLIFLSLLCSRVVFELFSQFSEDSVLEGLEFSERADIPPDRPILPVFGNGNGVLEVPIANILAELSWLFEQEVNHATFFVLEDRRCGHVVEQLQEIDSQFFIVCELAEKSVIFDYRQVVFFEDSEGFGWRHARIWGIVFNDGIKVDGDICIFDQVLEVRVSTVLSDEGPSSHVLLQ